MATPENSPTHDDLFSEGVSQMSLDEFADAGLVLTVHSRLLDDTVLLASDNASVPEGRRVVYRAAELRILDRLGADGLRHLHRFKRLLGGTVRSVEPRSEAVDVEPLRTSA